jgi:hypothetical protein
MTLLSVPIIDIGPYWTGADAGKRAVAAAVEPHPGRAYQASPSRWGLDPSSARPKAQLHGGPNASSTSAHYRLPWRRLVPDPERHRFWFPLGLHSGERA